MNAVVQSILDKNNGGLDIFHSLIGHFPTNKKFRLREDDKTPSASIKNIRGYYILSDFGDDEYVGLNAFNFYMKWKGVDFSTAVKNLGGQDSYGKKTKPKFGKDNHINKVDYDIVLNDKYYLKTKAKPEPNELKTLGRYIKADTLKKYDIHCLEKYAIYKESEKTYTIISATEDYPIYAYRINSESYKIYQPKNEDKSFKFFWVGSRPNDFVFGLKQILEVYNKGEDSKIKVPYILKCSGEKDTLNAISLGYPAFCLNSETADFDPITYNKIQECTDQIVNVPDTDSTGLKMAKKEAEKYIKMATLYLPLEEMMGKDLTDYVNGFDFSKNEFKKLVNTAKRLRFWDFIDKKIFFSPTCLNYFLNHFGFYRIKKTNSEVSFIHIINGIYEEINHIDVKDFVINWIDKSQADNHLSDSIRTTRALSLSRLESLSSIELPEHKETTSPNTYIYTESHTITINKKVEICNNKNLSNKKLVSKKLVSENFIIGAHKNKEKDEQEKQKIIGKAPFTIGKDGNVEIHNNNIPFLNYLINTSRIYWKEELEANPESYYDNKHSLESDHLTKEQCDIQKKHFVNKIFCLGYMINSRKDLSNAYAVVCTDNAVEVDIKKSYGGTGKSLFSEAIKQTVNTYRKSVRDSKIVDSDFVWAGVREEHQAAILDDAHLGFDFNKVFAFVNGDIEVNEKNKPAYRLPFEKSPKLLITSNYPMKGNDPAHERRIVYCLFSDYYHYDPNEKNGKGHQPIDDFGKEFFIGWNNDEWVDFLSLMGHCVVFHNNNLNTKINPPTQNLEVKRAIAEIGKRAMDYLNELIDENENYNVYFNKKLFVDNFRRDTGLINISTSALSNILDKWANYKGCVYNPKRLRDDKNRVRHSIGGVQQNCIIFKKKE